MRALAFVISFFWTTAFAMMAMAAAGMIPAGPAQMAIIVAMGGQGAVFAVGFLLVSAVFLWAFATVLFDQGAVPGDVDWVFRIAVASAILVTTIFMLLLAPHRPIEAFAGALFGIAALTASMSAVDAECRTLERTADKDEVGAVAGLMAAGAAHNSMLSVISRRNHPGKEEL